MPDADSREIWGVLGGMGPIASAEFLKTIYELSAGKVEQQTPIVVLISDPTFPDRTEYLLHNQEGLLLEPLRRSLLRLVEIEVTRIVICCMTIHHLVPQLPDPLKQRIVNLLDLVFAAVLRSERKHLLLCTTGSRRTELYQRQPLWEKTKGRIVLPESEDQRQVHDLIYQIKRGRLGNGRLSLVDSLLAKYGVDSFIAGCTEIHVLAKQIQRATHAGVAEFCIDPLTIVAREIAGCRSEAGSAIEVR